MLKLFVALINIKTPLRILTKMLLTSLDTYDVANKPCIGLLKAYFPSFFARTMGGVVADRVLQSFKSNWLAV